MKKLYWISLILTFICIALEIILACLKLDTAALIVSAVMLIFALLAVSIYFCFVKFKCPKCGTVFKGNKVEMFFAAHTPTKRKMRCPVCNEKLWCEDCFEKEKMREE